tara:strand:- start:721 stop:1128 length:408 start_codon:yes stop_codon:yes gene_type:complete
MNLDILKIASSTKYNKNIEEPTHYSKLKNPLCGDEIQIKLVVNKDKIVDFGYEGKYCIYCQASVSLLSEMSINKELVKVDQLCQSAERYFEGKNEISEKKTNSLKKLFNKKNLSRKECILLPFKTFKKIKKKNFK